MRAPDPDQIVALQERGVRLAELQAHDSWADLCAVFEERRKKHFDGLARQLLAGMETDQRLLDRTAGFFKGAEWILKVPELSEQSLEQALRKAELFEALQEGTRR